MKQTIKIKVNENDKLSNVFKNGLIPNNSNIDKKRTGNGITTAEILAKRHSIIINPQVNTIKQKAEEWLAKNYNICCLYDERGDDVASFLKNSTENKKIFVTPESFPTLIKTAKDLGMLKALQHNFFCLLDESHCFASEKFRTRILNPIDYVFKFKNISMASATPFAYTDPRVENLQQYEILYDKPRGYVNVIHASQPRKAIEYMILNGDFKGNVHIFLNSVTTCGKIVRNTRIFDVNIYCADTKENHIKLFDMDKYFKPEPKRTEYAKFNFYSCRYIEGWDMIDDENTTIILVTDTGVSHSLISIPIKAVQCIGRLRSKPLQVIHLTNNFDEDDHEVEIYQDIEDRMMFEAEFLVETCIRQNIALENLGFYKPSILNKTVSNYSNMDYGVPSFCHFKTNQMIYLEFTLNNYANRSTILKNWTDADYTVEETEWEIEMPTLKDLSKSQINKHILKVLLEYRRNPNKYRFGIANQTVKRLENGYSTLFQALVMMGADRIKELGYSDYRMKKELIKLNNNNALAKIVSELDTIFVIGNRYTKAYIKKTLQHLFDKHEYLDDNKKVMRAKATQLETLNLYSTKDTPIPDGKGKRLGGFEIIAKHFNLKAAA